MGVTTTTSTGPGLETLGTHDEDHPGTHAAAAAWAELTARSAALCRRDPQLWQACADRSEELEAQGMPSLVAVRAALQEFHA